MKTTIEISDHILNRARELGHRRHTTLRSLVEEGLTRVLDEEDATKAARVKPVTFKGRGLSDDFKGAGWSELRDASYRGRGS